GEDAAEHRLQPHLRALVLRDGALQELVVGRLLDVDEVRNLDDLSNATEMLADPEVRLDDTRHRYSCAFRLLRLAGYARRRSRVSRRENRLSARVRFVCTRLRNSIDTFGVDPT